MLLLCIANRRRAACLRNFLFLVYIGMTMSKTLVFPDDGLEMTDSVSGTTVRVPKVCLSFVDSCDILGCSSDDWATRPDSPGDKMPSCTVEGASPCCGLGENKTYCFGGNWSTVQCNFERDPALEGCEQLRARGGKLAGERAARCRQYAPDLALRRWQGARDLEKHGECVDE